MTESEKKELVDLFTGVLEHRNRACPLGIHPGAARELIDFAAAWKRARKTALITLIGALVTSVFAAILAGLRSILS